MKSTFFKTVLSLCVLTTVSLLIQSCKPKGPQSALSGNAADRTFVAPGTYDEFYNFVSGGFSGQLSVYGLPSGRLFRVIPVFSLNSLPEGRP